MQPASTAGNFPCLLLHTPSGGKRNLWNKWRWQLKGKICLVCQYFNTEESDNKVVCWLCLQKLAYNHLIGAMRSRVQLASTFATQTHRRCDADCLEKIMQIITEMTACDMLPVCFVEIQSFHKFTHYIEPKCTLLSCTT